MYHEIALTLLMLAVDKLSGRSIKLELSGVSSQLSGVPVKIETASSNVDSGHGEIYRY